MQSKRRSNAASHPALRLLRTLIVVLLLAAGPTVGGAQAQQAPAESPWLSVDAAGQPRIELYFFWSLTCPHCTAAHPFVDAIPAQRPWVRVQALELSRHPDNRARFANIAALAGGEAAAVPSFAFCGQLVVGWDHPDGIGAALLAGLDACRSAQQAGAPQPTTDPAVTSAPIDLPLLGRLDPGTLSLPALTLVLAGLDAFNPCAFFVLLFLLSLLAHQRSPARMLAIGGVFVAMSGLMYFAFMAAWLNLFQLLGHLAGVTLAAGVVALLVGIVNIKDFFWFQRGLSLSVPAAQKPDLFRRVRAIVSAERPAAVLAATVLLAITANFYELLCTAGFPMVFTRMLTLADLSATTRHAYLAAYCLIYVLPLGAIVVLFARSLGARRLSKREGRLLKLLSGLMMLGLGSLLLLDPARLNQVGSAFGLMALAVALTWLAARLIPHTTGEDD